jgi:hypothetical protein
MEAGASPPRMKTAVMAIFVGMCMITACFARAFQRCTNRTYMHFLLMFQEARPIRKTRNLFIDCLGYFIIKAHGEPTSLPWLAHAKAKVELRSVYNG